MLPLIVALLRLVPRKKTLADVDPVSLRRERVKFEHAERRLSDEISEMEAEKDKLFRLGSSPDVTDRERVTIARKIKQMDQLVLSRDRNLALLNRNLHVVEALCQLLENQSLVKELGLSKGVLAKLDLEQIKQYVDEASVEGQVSMERLADLLAATTNANDVFASGTEADPDEQQLVELMRTAAANSFPPIRPQEPQNKFGTTEPPAAS